MKRRNQSENKAKKRKGIKKMNCNGKKLCRCSKIIKYECRKVKTKNKNISSNHECNDVHVYIINDFKILEMKNIFNGKESSCKRK